MVSKKSALVVRTTRYNRVSHHPQLSHRRRSHHEYLPKIRSGPARYGHLVHSYLLLGSRSKGGGSSKEGEGGDDLHGGVFVGLM